MSSFDDIHLVENKRHVPMTSAELVLRKGLWVNHGCQFVALYGDDGEMQCNALNCRHDFLREPLLDLVAALIAEGRLHVGQVKR